MKQRSIICSKWKLIFWYIIKHEHHLSKYYKTTLYLGFVLKIITNNTLVLYVYFRCKIAVFTIGGTYTNKWLLSCLLTKNFFPQEQILALPFVFVTNWTKAVMCEDSKNFRALKVWPHV